MKSQKSSVLPRKPKRPVIVRRIYGHSMLPVLPPGTLVLGLLWFRRIRPGDIVIFEHDGKEKIKRVDQLEGNKLYLLGDHQETSTDSRHFGWVPRETVIAKLVWPQAPRHRAEGVSPPDKSSPSA